MINFVFPTIGNCINKLPQFLIQFQISLGNVKLTKK